MVNGSQQQWYTRNSQLGSWSNGVWNQTFTGVEGAPQQSFSNLPTTNQPYTTLATTPASKEKPYVYIDRRGEWKVFVPRAEKNSSGPSWVDGPTPGRSLPMSSFFVARPSDSAKKIDKQLAKGKNLLFTPGVYSIDRSLKVKKAGTVLLGLGIATLTADAGRGADQGLRRPRRRHRRADDRRGRQELEVAARRSAPARSTATGRRPSSRSPCRTSSSASAGRTSARRRRA